MHILWKALIITIAIIVLGVTLIYFGLFSAVGEVESGKTNAWPSALFWTGVFCMILGGLGLIAVILGAFGYGLFKLSSKSSSRRIGRRR